MKSRFSHQDWRRADEITSSKLDQKLKEPQLLLFFKGAIYETTFNTEGKFSNTQLVMLFELPSEEDLFNWRKIKLLKCPIGDREIVYDPTRTQDSYIQEGFVEILVGPAPERTQLLQNNVQAKRKQYGLKHRVSSTIHEAMGDTLPSVATEISLVNSKYSMWDKGQMIVITSRTKKGKNT